MNKYAKNKENKNKKNKNAWDDYGPNEHKIKLNK